MHASVFDMQTLTYNSVLLLLVPRSVSIHSC